jgi:hypothetical protein
MSNSLEPKKGDRIEKPFEPDLKKGSSSTTAPVKPQAPQQPKPKKC